MRILVVIFSILLLSGCAMTSSAPVEPDGKPVHFIDGMSTSVNYNKAAQLCPNGYKSLGEPRQTTVIDYVMTIEGQ